MTVGTLLSHLPLSPLVSFLHSSEVDDGMASPLADIGQPGVSWSTSVFLSFVAMHYCNSSSRHPSIWSDNGKRHGFGHQFYLEQRLAWLTSPILEWQSLLQVVQRKVEGWLESGDS